MENTSVLIGTFIRGGEFLPRKKARNIFEEFGCKQIFCFETKEEDGKNSFLLTFNINDQDKNDKFKQFKEKFKNSIQLHRNKDTNTLYTINSLNKVIESQNGSSNKEYKVDWENYKNCCVLLNKDKQVKVIPTKLRKVFKTE